MQELSRTVEISKLNSCVFSCCKCWRYSLKHSWKSTEEEEKPIVWIGLNPSTADENQLDPTLRRIRNFSESWGYNCFYMLNLFAYRATKPKDMFIAEDAIGPDNDSIIYLITSQIHDVVCAWGTTVRRKCCFERIQKVASILKTNNIVLNYQKIIFQSILFS